MKNRRNYYRILQVQPDAPAEIIRASYRTLMQKLKMHPDLGGDKVSAAVLNEAYAVLSDPARRASYDEENAFFNRQAAESSKRAEVSPEPPPQEKKRPHSEPRANPRAERDQPKAEPLVVRCEFCNGVVAVGHQRPVSDTCGQCNSPLTPVASLGEERLDPRRGVGRVEKSLGIQFYTRWPQPQPHAGMAFDLSIEGMGLNTLVAVPMGSLIKVDSPSVRGLAKVVNCRTTKLNGRPVYQLGAQFLTVEFTQVHGTFVSERA